MFLIYLSKQSESNCIVLSYLSELKVENMFNIQLLEFCLVFFIYLLKFIIYYYYDNLVFLLN